jgi:hypothetical protein
MGIKSIKTTALFHLCAEIRKNLNTDDLKKHSDQYLLCILLIPKKENVNQDRIKLLKEFELRVQQFH